MGNGWRRNISNVCRCSSFVVFYFFKNWLFETDFRLVGKELRDNMFAIDKELLVSGCLQLMVCCLWGLIPGDSMANYRAFFGAHHQFSHNAEVLLVLSVIAPHLPMSKLRRRIFNVATHLATWCNPLGYCCAAIAGSAWVGSDHDAAEISREWTTGSYLSFAFVPVITGPACFVAFGMLLSSALSLRQTPKNGGKT